MGDFLDTLDIITSVLRHRFMIVGQRRDLDVKGDIDFSNPSWENNLRKEVAERGGLHSVCGIDYHIFEKGIGTNMPSFVAGRICWDMWFLSEALRIGYDVVDATGKIFAIHQKHTYTRTAGKAKGRRGEEAIMNKKLSQGRGASIKDANWRFLNGKLTKR